jgi:hypothetical protein
MKGSGVVAGLNIKKSELICEYSRDIVPTSYKRNKMKEI